MTLVPPGARPRSSPSAAARSRPAPAEAARVAARRPILGRRFRRTAAPSLGPVLLALALLAAARQAPAQELDSDINSAGIIDYPTALDQRTANMVHGTVEIADLSSPDLRLANLRYGRQLGSLQLLADMYDLTEPTREFAYAEAKAKLRVFNLEALHTTFALGALTRWTDERSKDETLLDNKPYSLLGVLTTELFPFEQWGAFLLNLYVDNRFADAGLKVQVYEGIRFVAETDYHLVEVRDDPHKARFRAGLEFEGNGNFYAQLLYDDTGNHARLQIGAGF